MLNRIPPPKYSERFAKRAIGRLRKSLEAQFPDLPFTPTLSRLGELVDHLDGQTMPPVPELDDEVMLLLAREAMHFNCSPRVVFTAYQLCIARDGLAASRRRQRRAQRKNWQ